VKAAEQLQRWHEQELRTQDRAAVSDLKQAAIQATDDATALIQAHRNILRTTLAVNDRLDWDAMKDTRPYDRPAPTLEDFNRKLAVPPEQSLLEGLRLVSKSKRLKLETAARQAHQAAVWEFENARANHEAALMKQNEEIDAFRKAYDLFSQVQRFPRAWNAIVGSSTRRRTRLC
jgi:restriction system protein